MPIFAVTAPHLTPDHHYQLEEALLEIPGVDAFFNEEGTLGTEVTAPEEALEVIVAAVVAWSNSHETGSSAVQLTCPGGAVAGLAEYSAGQLVDFLRSCGENGEELQGLTKRLADDGVHEGR